MPVLKDVTDRFALGRGQVPATFSGKTVVRTHRYSGRRASGMNQSETLKNVGHALPLAVGWLYAPCYSSSTTLCWEARCCCVAGGTCA
jgi:hypothetical protein